MEVSYNKTRRRSGEVDPSAHLATASGVRIELVGTHAHRRDHGAEDVQAPGEGRQHAVVAATEAESQERQPRY